MPPSLKCVTQVSPDWTKLIIAYQQEEELCQVFSRCHLCCRLVCEVFHLALIGFRQGHQHLPGPWDFLVLRGLEVLLKNGGLQSRSTIIHIDDVQQC